VSLYKSQSTNRLQLLLVVVVLVGAVGHWAGDGEDMGREKVKRELLGVDGQTIARWEKTGHVPKWADKFLRVI
jgi:hypothetical protein